MTALKPIENRRVKGVASERYPLNEKCAHPECSESADDPHHAFPRSLIGGDSWFVQFGDEDGIYVGPCVPHVTGLCRAHHDDVEQHRAWIRLEDGTFVWYDEREPTEDETASWSAATGEHPDSYPIQCWELVGPLNPQPGSREGKPKRKKFQGEARRQRTTISIRVPKDEAEDGGEVYDDLIEQCQEKLQKQMGVEFTPTPYITLVAVMHSYLTGGTNG